MKMTKRAVNVTVFTVIALMFALVFGYTFRMFHEINAMDLSGKAGGGRLGRAATDMVEDQSLASGQDEIDAVNRARTVIMNCMDDNDTICSVRADYANHRMVFLVLADGTAAAAEQAQDGDTEKWDNVRSLGSDVSGDGARILQSSGLEGWSFYAEVLNDSYPLNAVLAFEDGACTYDCVSR